jgi:hypothetical protein
MQREDRLNGLQSHKGNQDIRPYSVHLEAQKERNLQTTDSVTNHCNLSSTPETNHLNLVKQAILWAPAQGGTSTDKIQRPDE